MMVGSRGAAVREEAGGKDDNGVETFAREYPAEAAGEQRWAGWAEPPPSLSCPVLCPARVSAGRLPPTHRPVLRGHSSEPQQPG